jgi:hypothetical protein
VHAGKKDNKKSGHGGGAASHSVQQRQGNPQLARSKASGKPNKSNGWNNAQYSNKGKKRNNSNQVNASAGARTHKTNWDGNTNNRNNAQYSKKGKKWNNANYANASSGAQVHKSNWKAQTKHYNLAYKYNPSIQNVKFQKNYRIAGAEHWNGTRYAAFRNYNAEWHDRSWWRNRYNRVVFNSGGWYYWNSGWWYPAWGYAPNAYYAYNGPIYGYNGLSPDQVTANVQATLQQQGYYTGGVDGLLGPATRAALANYQRNHGLYVTSAIDQPTLESLGMA